jgi:hypothetical protein
MLLVSLKSCCSVCDATVCLKCVVSLLLAGYLLLVTLVTCQYTVCQRWAHVSIRLPFQCDQVFEPQQKIDNRCGTVRVVVLASMDAVPNMQWKYVYLCTTWSSHSMVTQSAILWDITPCSPLKVNRRFGGTCRLRCQSRRISKARNQRETGVKQNVLVSYSLIHEWEATYTSETSVDFNGLYGVISLKDRTLHVYLCFHRLVFESIFLRGMLRLRVVWWCFVRYHFI